MCCNTLACADLVMRNDSLKRDTLNTFMEEDIDYAGEVEVLHLLSFIRDSKGFYVLGSYIN